MSSAAGSSAEPIRRTDTHIDGQDARRGHGSTDPERDLDHEQPRLGAVQFI